MNSNVGLMGPNNFGLVTLSVSLAVLSTYAALDLAGRMSAAKGRLRLAWLAGSSVAMGIGISVTHAIAMEAAVLPIRARYDWPTILLSFCVSFVASGAGFYLVSNPSAGLARIAACSLFIGIGIAGTHYIGVDAVRVAATPVYSASMVAISVALAVVLSFFPIYLTFSTRDILLHLGWRKFLSALILGTAAPVTHYVGMAAVRFMPAQGVSESQSRAVNVFNLGVTSIAIGAITILGLAFLTSIIDRQASLNAQRVADREAQLQTIFDNLAEGIVVLDRNRNVAQMNRAAVQLFGLSERTDEIEAALDAFEMYALNGEPIRREERPIPRALRGEYLENAEFQLRTKGTGHAVICTVNSAPIQDRAGGTVQVMVRFRDITERKKMDEARIRLAAIVESSEDAIIGKDLHGIITAWNRGAEKIFGYTAEEMIGHSILRLLPPGHEREEDEILERIGNGERIDHFETMRRKKDGQLIHTQLTISPILDANNHVIGASKIARDITGQKLMEKQLHQSQKMEAIGQLTGGVAHDFNNLLGIIVGNLDLLERMVSEQEKALKRVQTAQRAAARGADLTRRLLAFSRREELRPTNIVLEDSIQNVIDLAHHAIGPEIVVVTHFDQSVPPVFVDPAAFESALLNLMVNARDAMPKGGSLTISTKLRELEASYPPVATGEIAAGCYACISVSDTGHGMSPGTLERAFEPFFSTKPRNKGTGLGLAMVYGFVKQSKGTVRLYSEVGYGTTVSLYLPLASRPLETGETALPAVSPPKVSGKVLVVDDETELIEIASAYLEEMGYVVLHAEDGASALEVFSRHEDIDLIITDIIMPGGVNGMELAQKVRVLSPATKIIFTSGFPSDALAERNGTHVDGPLLNKPYQRAEFAAMVRKTMEGIAPNTGQWKLLDPTEKGRSGGTGMEEASD